MDLAAELQRIYDSEINAALADYGTGVSTFGWAMM